MLDIIKKIIVLLVLVVLGYFAYTIFLVSPTGISESQVTGEQMLGADILTLVDKLEATNIDPSIFSSSLFMTLHDFSVPVSPEAVGKSNPFIFTDTGVSVEGTLMQTVPPVKSVTR